MMILREGGTMGKKKFPVGRPANHQKILMFCYRRKGEWFHAALNYIHSCRSISSVMGSTTIILITLQRPRRTCRGSRAGALDVSCDRVQFVCVLVGNDGTGRRSGIRAKDHSIWRKKEILVRPKCRTVTELQEILGNRRARCQELEVT